MKNWNRTLGFSEKAFHRMLWLYPEEFRLRFGPEMAQIFRDRYREEQQRGRKTWLVMLWLEIISDLALSATGEYLERKKIMKNSAADVSLILQRYFRFLLRGVGWSLGGLAVITLLAWISCSLYVWHKRPSVVDLWKQTAGQTPDEQLQTLLQRFPKTAQNKTATEIEHRAQVLGFHSPAALTASKSLPPPKANLIADANLSFYLEKQVRTPLDEIDRVPPEVDQFLNSHGRDLRELYLFVQNSEAPRWEMDYGRGIFVPIPSWLFHQQLQQLIIVDALPKIQQGRGPDALLALEASWKINQSLLERPELISQMIGLGILRNQAGVLRKMNQVPPDWQKRLNLDLQTQILYSLGVDSIVTADCLPKYGGKMISGSAGPEYLGSYLGLIGKPLYYLWGLQDLELMAQSIGDLKSADACTFDPDRAQRHRLDSISFWEEGKRYVSSPLRAWKLATYVKASLELTCEVLRVKALSRERPVAPLPNQQTQKTSSLCPHIQWLRTQAPDGSITIQASHLPVWLKVESARGMPLSYTVAYPPKRTIQTR